MNRVDRHFTCMGSRASVALESATVPAAALARYAAQVRAVLVAAERTLSRFRDDSELSRLNRDPRPVVPASPLMRRFAACTYYAGTESGGLVDATLLGELEAQGYETSRWGTDPAPLADALRAAPERRPAHARAAHMFDRVRVDARCVVRPKGLRLDSGGIGKGLAADVAAATLPRSVRYAISCGGDLAVGPDAWEVTVEGVLATGVVHRLHVPGGGVATSGIGSRIWRRPDGSFAHHVLDPSTGEPAWTGLVAATAVAGSAVEAEVLAKAALLSGPERARRLLGDRGGVLQHDSGAIEVVAA